MFNLRSLCAIASLGFMVLITGCNDNATADDSPAQVAQQKEQPGYAVGRVTFPDGSPITGDVVDYAISIHGVSEAAEKVHYSPIVKNGAYKQKLVPGQYSFSQPTITVKHNGTDYTLYLEPVGRNWNKNQDAADGIVQDFVWKVTGVQNRYADKPDPNNHTHWHGMNFGMRFATYRDDIKAGPTPPPDGSKLTFTLTPKSKCIDGRELQPMTVERDWRANDVTQNDDLNDIPPADWEITGVIKFPDGTTRNLLFMGSGDYPNFVKVGKGPLQRDQIIGGYFKQLFSWAIE